MIIWQFLLFVSMLGAGLLILSRHMEGYREDAAQIAMGTAGVVGILLIITGFSSLGGEEKPTEQQPPQLAARSAPEATKPLPAPVQQPIPVRPQPVAPAQILTLPSVPQYDLGAPGAAYQRVEAVMMRYRDMYQQGVNDIQRTELRFARGRELCQLQAAQYAVAARLQDVSTDKNGNARATFVSSNGVEFIPSGEFSRGSAIHSALANVAPGATVGVLFTFDSDDTGKDCFHSNRWTEKNNMTQPRWDVNVLGITPLP